MVEGIGIVLLATTLAGAAIPLGALLADREHLKRGHFRTDLLATIVAFGGGVLLAAVAFVLVPEGLGSLRLAPAVAAIALGAGAFLVLDRRIERRGDEGGNLIAMVADFVPESIALGAAFALGGATGPLLALLIGLQNLPEGFNAYKDLQISGQARGRRLGILSALMFLGPVSGVLGFYVLSRYPLAVGWVMLFAAGGILYVLFHDVAPTAHRDGHWVPTLGAVAGFLVGVVGQALLG